MKTKIVKISLLTAILASSLLADENLKKVTVTTPDKTTQYLQNTTSSIDLINADEIEERGYKTITDALRHHSGIAFARNGGLGQTSSIFLRGFPTNRVLVLVDGVRYNDPTSLNGAAYEHILLGDVDRIEIVKNPQSGIWGADASGGVINIITKKAQKDGAVALVYAEYGSFNTQTYGINSSFKQDKLDLALNLQRVTSDGFSAKVANGKVAKDFEDDGYENNTYGLSIGYFISDKDKIGAFYRYIDADSDFDGFDANATKAANDPLSNATSKEKFYGVSYQHFESSYDAKLYYQRSDFSRVSKSGGFKSNFDGSVDESGINANYRVSSDLRVGGGADLKKFKHKNKIDKDYQNQGLFLNITDIVREDIGDTTLSAVVRYDSFDEFDNKTTYRFGFKHTPSSNKELNIFANYGTGYNAPLLYQLYGEYVGNKDLNPEKSRGYDVGFEYGGFKFSYFYDTIEDMIDYKMTDPANFVGAYYNLEGKTTLKGVEASLDGSMEDLSLAYNLNYTYLKTEDAKGKELPRRPKSMANLSLDYYGIANTHLGALISYVGKKKATFGEDYDSYTLLDLSVGYDLNSGLNIYARVENALDKEYENIRGYGVSERAYYVGFRYKVK